MIFMSVGKYRLFNPPRSINCFINRGRSPRLMKQLIDRGKGSITFLLANKGDFPLGFHFEVSNLNKVYAIEIHIKYRGGKAWRFT